jgi:hypothetical protein
VLQAAHDALRPLQRHGSPINAQNVERVRTVAYAMRKAAEIAEAQIVAYEETKVVAS